jgi:hypothetical protein
MSTSSTLSPPVVRGSEELYDLLEGVLAPIEDLLDVMAVPLEALDAEEELASGAGRESIVSEPLEATTRAGAATTTLVVQESIAREGGRAEIHREDGHPLEIAIPPGVVTGDLLRLPPDLAGSPSGLLLQVLVLPDRSPPAPAGKRRGLFRRRRPR